MSAFDDILSHHSKEKFKDFRQALVSHKRGTLSSGTFSESMAVIYDNDATQTSILDESSERPIKKILFLKHGQIQHPGLIFDTAGTDRALSVVANNGRLKLYEEFANYLKFHSQDDKDAWAQSDRASRKRCMVRNIDDLIKKTDVNYRTHGDRLHYLVAGLVTTRQGKLTNHYPLFLFSCSDLNRHTLEAEIEPTGFLNFWLDRTLLENTAVTALGGYEVNLNESFPSLINNIASKIGALQSSQFDEISIDAKYTALVIVTGFEAEYIDPVWGKIL
jgi:hypothetical protein